MDTLHTVGVIGAGVMGIGVAQSLAQGGYAVVLVDVAAAALTKSHDEIYSGARFHHLMGDFHRDWQPCGPRVSVRRGNVPDHLQ